MEEKETKRSFLNGKVLPIVGILAVFLAAVALLWYSNATSMQAHSAVAAQVYFDGDYRIGDSDWQKIEKGKHIPATRGDVTLRGNFHLLSPGGEYIGIYTGKTPIAFYTDHIGLTFYQGEGEPYTIDHENPLFGASACGVDWTAHVFQNLSEDPIEIVVHNPHSFGNETAIDQMLSATAFWAGIDFEKAVMEKGDVQRDLGLFFVIVSLLFLGCALFSMLIHAKNTKILWVLGCVILFAGTYLTYSADGVCLWSESVVSNTVILGCSMMFFTFFLSVAMVCLLKKTKKAAKAAVVALGVCNALFLVLPIVTPILFYDAWLYWGLAQLAVDLVLGGCIVREVVLSRGKERLLYLGLLLPLISFALDFILIGCGVVGSAVVCQGVFIVFFLASTVTALKIIPGSINALAKARELETEKLVLDAQLAESRISTMMSQIRPHFIYNTLGSIEQLCTFDPVKAGELVHNFAKYLRGNFRELDNPKPILMSQEMEHVRHYVSIENVRFPDMTFSFEMKSEDFYLPALTVQPIVENAIKHGLMKLQKGGTIRVVSYEDDGNYYVLVEDDGAGFDTGVLLDERKHVGIRNIRGRLQAMVDGTLEIESKEGGGTKVLIRIPKEAKR